MSYDDPNDAPKADSTRWYKCDACEHLHVLLQDEQDRTIASAVIDEGMLKRMLETVQGPPTEIMQ